MAHIVYITNGMASTLNSSLELSRRLHDAGHRVSYLSPADLEAEVTAHGYPFRRLASDQSFRKEAARHRRPRNPLRWPGWFRRRREIRRRSLENREVETVVEELSPDLLLIDFEMHWAIITTARLGIPTFLPIVWFSFFRQPGLPPLRSKLIPDESNKRSIEAAWRRLRRENFLLRWRERFSGVGLGDWIGSVTFDTNRYARLRSLARSRGFPLREETSRAHWARPFVYRSLPVLSFNAEELEFPHERYPNIHYVGPMVKRSRREIALEGKALAGWQELQREYASNQSPRPLIYCSLGSHWSADREFLRRVVAVFEKRNDWQLVLGLGGKLAPADLAPVPCNALLLDWAPQLEVLALARCAITHGGITTINECLLHEVPMVVYSTGHVDQDGCAARLRYHRLAVVGDRERATSEEIETNIEAVLTDPKMPERLALTKGQLEAYETANIAVNLLESAIAQARSTSDSGGSTG